AGSGGGYYGRRGRITRSINLPPAAHVGAGKTLKSANEPSSMFSSALAQPPVITYFRGGNSAANAAPLLALLGYERLKVYDNSLTEWAADPSLPMETGT